MESFQKIFHNSVLKCNFRQIQEYYKKKEFSASFKPMNCLDRFIKTGKNKLDKMDRNEIIYKIGCLDWLLLYGTEKKIKKIKLN